MNAMKIIGKCIGDACFSLIMGTIMILIMIAGLPSQGAEQPTEISVGSSVLSASANETVSTSVQQTGRNASLAGGVSHIQVLPFFGPAMNTAGAETVHRKLIEDSLAGAINKSSGYIPIDDGKIPWTALCYAEGNPTGWLVLQQLIVVHGDSISISQISMEQNSTADVLDDNYVVGNRGYGPAAIGVKSDGSKIESGPGTQTANTVLFITQMKMFNMGATHEGQKTVRTYTLGQKDLSVTVTARNGSSSSTTSVVVVMPKLFLSTVWDPRFQQVVELSILGDAPGFMYDLYQTSDPNGPWIGMGEVSSVGREIVQESVKFAPYRFFKALPRP